MTAEARAGRSLGEVAAYLDERLQIRQIRDYRNALNGLQVANGGFVHRIAAAVDASEQTIGEAASRGCDLLLVHHGLFWSGNRPVTGSRYRRLRAVFGADMAVYSAHLPLDVHPELGNNVLLARALGMDADGTFSPYEGRDVGITASTDRSRDDLAAALESVLKGPVTVIAGGPDRIRRVGILTGSGGGAIEEAAQLGLDALITGEGSHHTFIDATESGINLFYGGHYATEVFGVRALAAELSARFDLPWEFIDAPTGM
jgi:dinuclear metal center YbgI/SA1388 family protein